MDSTLTRKSVGFREVDFLELSFAKHRKCLVDEFVLLLSLNLKTKRRTFVLKPFLE